MFDLLERTEQSACAEGTMNVVHVVHVVHVHAPNDESQLFRYEACI